MHFFHWYHFKLQQTLKLVIKIIVILFIRYQILPLILYRYLEH